MKILTALVHTPQDQWVRFILFFLAITVFIGIAEVLRKSVGWSQEVNRKIVHILTGILVFLSPLFFTHAAPLVVLGVIFTIINAVGLFTGSLKGMDSERKSYGTIFFPVSFIILVLACWPGNRIVIMTSILVMGIADALAAIVGESVRHPHTYNLIGEKKSLEGSAAMGLATAVIVTATLGMAGKVDGIYIGFANIIWIAAVCALFVTALESLSIAGSDNLNVPLGSAFIIGYMLSAGTNDKIMLSAGLILSLAVAVLSYRAGALNAGGSVATFILGVVVFGTGGIAWAVPILVFFILSSMLSRIQKKRKARFSLLFEKSDTRDAFQVGANGGVAGLIVIANVLFPMDIWYYLYLGTLAAVTSDTWATELGVLSKHRPVSLRTFKPTVKGQSGAVSFMGTANAFLGSLIIVLTGLAAAPSMFPGETLFPLAAGICAAGFLGSIVDSLTGAFLQIQFKCTHCGTVTEKHIHCPGYETQPVSGISWITNDVVNLACSVSGAVFTYVFVSGIV